MVVQRITQMMMSEEINATIRNIADCRSMMEWRGLFHLITRNFIFLHI